MVVVPSSIPITAPAALTVPMAVFELLHVPPGVVLLSVVVLPSHTVVVPVIAAGVALTTTLMVVVATPPKSSITCTVNASVPVKPVVGVYVSPVGVSVLPVEVTL